ncbi:MAG: DNA methyltransferase [Gammaproteobacteria bacterium]|nr:DNA methyltransferase [Gammaproteobacteria bacterium]
MTANWQNRTLFHGDNLAFMRAMNSESVDLIATDPPFNKGRDFHATPDSLAAGAKFQDRWTWEEDVHQSWIDEITDDNPGVMEAIQGARRSYGDDMGAFLCFMAVRLLAMRRILKPTGSIYLHCDSTASHYLKQIMDAVFGRRNFVNEIVWQKIRSSKAQKAGFGPVHDVILFYRASPQAAFNNIYVPLSDERIAKHYRKVEEGTGRRYMLDNFTQAGAGKPKKFGERVIAPPEGKHWIWDQERIDKAWAEGRLVFTSEKMVRVKRYLDESKGNPVEDIWIDIPPINAVSQERVGYPTQKPLALYERILAASSNEGDVVLDPFAGCATTLVAAERLGRQWVGIDIWEGAHKLVEQRLSDTTGIFGNVTFTRQLPTRTDDGETASPFLRVKETIREPEGRKMSRAEMYDYLLAQHGQKCQGCDREFDDPRYLELDHNTPRSSGGINHISNRILLCGPCNRLKSNVYTLIGLRRENKKRGYMSHA